MVAFELYFAYTSKVYAVAAFRESYEISPEGLRHSEMH